MSALGKGLSGWRQRRNEKVTGFGLSPLPFLFFPFSFDERDGLSLSNM